MNLPTSVGAFAVIVILFIPGYVFLQFTRSAVAFILEAADARYFFAVLTWGGLIHLAFFWWTRHLLDWYLNNELDHHEDQGAFWALTDLILAPLAAGLTGSWLIKQPSVDRALGHIGMDCVIRTPSAWNYSMKLGPRWVRVHLKDRTLIGGTYGQGAFADDTDEKDLLDRNGDFQGAVCDSAGVWIKHDEISHIMFYTPGTKEEPTNDQ